MRVELPVCLNEMQFLKDSADTNKGKVNSIIVVKPKPWIEHKRLEKGLRPEGYVSPLAAHNI
jgi:hypothetical protein